MTSLEGLWIIGELAVIATILAAMLYHVVGTTTRRR